MLLKDCTVIPDWLKDNLDTQCSYCGSDIEIGFSPNDNSITRHFCTNPECPGTVAAKMAFMWTTLGVEGIKEGNSMRLIKEHKLPKHYQYIPKVLDKKPDVDPVTFLRINCIKGIDTSWSSYIGDAKSIPEILNNPALQFKISQKDKDDIIDAMQYFNIVWPRELTHKAVLRLNIMMTGDIMGLPNREMLVHALNSKYDGLLDLRYSKSLRKTGIDYLVREDNATVTNKIRTAIEYGIPQITPKDFICLVDKLIQERSDYHDS